MIQHKGSSANKQRQEAPHAHNVRLDPANRFAYVSDLGIDKIMIYQFNASTGKLTPNTPPSANLKPGAGPRHLTFHPRGKFAYVINELNSTITAFTLDKANGSLQELRQISVRLQPGPQQHSPFFHQ
jgi:6-phosphogluconolactonase